MAKYFWVRKHKKAQDDCVTGDINQAEFEEILTRLGINDIGVKDEIEELNQERLKCLTE